jgi:hypothetical protein
VNVTAGEPVIIEQGGKGGGTRTERRRIGAAATLDAQRIRSNPYRNTGALTNGSQRPIVSATARI